MVDMSGWLPYYSRRKDLGCGSSVTRAHHSEVNLRPTALAVA